MQTPTDLFAFGSRSGPRLPRPGRDYDLDDTGMFPAQSPELPSGASLFADVAQAPLRGHYHRLPLNTDLPSGLAVVADGRDVRPKSPHPPTHHTLYPVVTMSGGEFLALFQGLPWLYEGNKP